MACKARRVGCQMICGPCRKTWDADDTDPPLCEPEAVAEKAFRKMYENLGNVDATA